MDVATFLLLQMSTFKRHSRKPHKVKDCQEFMMKLRTCVGEPLPPNVSPIEAGSGTLAVIRNQAALDLREWCADCRKCSLGQDLVRTAA